MKRKEGDLQDEEEQREMPRRCSSREGSEGVIRAVGDFLLHEMDTRVFVAFSLYNSYRISLLICPGISVADETRDGVKSRDGPWSVVVVVVRIRRS